MTVHMIAGGYNRPPTAEQVAQMIAEYAEGYSTPEIGKHIGFNQYTVYRHLKLNGVQFRPKTQHSPKQKARREAKAGNVHTGRQCSRCAILITPHTDLRGLIVESVESPDPCLCRACWRRACMAAA